MLACARLSGDPAARNAEVGDEAVDPVMPVLAEHCAGRVASAPVGKIGLGGLIESSTADRTVSGWRAIRVMAPVGP